MNFIPTNRLASVKLFCLLLAVATLGKGYSQVLALPDTLRSCSVDSLFLDAGQGFDGYEWSTGDTTYYTFASQNGLYTVTVNSGDTLFIVDSVYICIIGARLAESSMILDCGDTASIHVDHPGFSCLWEPGSLTGDSITVFPRDTTMYFVTIRDTSDYLLYCVDSIAVTVNPKIKIDSLYQINMGCPGEEKGSMKLIASGGYAPYEFEWSDGYPLQGDSSIIIGMTDGDKTVTITDTIGCELIKSFEVKAFPFPETEIITDPGDTVYIQKPTVHFTYENISFDSLQVDTFRINDWIWDFGDDHTSSLLAPSNTYSTVGTYNVVLSYTTFYGCKGTDSVTIVVKPVKLKIPNVITPNSDNKNDYLKIALDEESGGGDTYKSMMNSQGEKFINDYYLSNTLVIFNRWGRVVYESNDYRNDWDADGLPDGVYFYVLKCKGQYNEDVYKGSITIFR
jgi:PKD repeat protein